MSETQNVICGRCNQKITFNRKNELCQRCLDVLEFGYPSFTPYRHAEAGELGQLERMELSEGWSLPNFLIHHNN